MAGELERARAAAALATAAVADSRFRQQQADYAVTVAKVAVGRAVDPVTTIAHQLHGAIGVTIEHRLWLATMRARSWADEFGTTGAPRRRLGRIALADRPVGPRRRALIAQASSTWPTRASTTSRSPRSATSMPNRSASASSTSAAVSKRIFSLPSLRWIARLRPRRL